MGVSHALIEGFRKWIRPRFQQFFGCFAGKSRFGFNNNKRLDLAFKQLSGGLNLSTVETDPQPLI
jgi:hypothetical protein